MNVIGCLDTPNEGEYWLNGTRVSSMSDDALARVRNKEIGFVFQTFNLLPRATALHNVELPLVYAGVSGEERKRRAREALSRVQLDGRMDHRPNELSGGQRQRVAIARAMAGQPKLVLADEPTANLDSVTAAKILDLLETLNARTHCTFIFATHDPALMSRARRCVRMHDGAIVNEPLLEARAS
jgi:putative ABC transport system ATP-binding protein